jgi:malate dehydrogenase (oxaloacetate-decarboxylating)(NADP+)
MQLAAVHAIKDLVREPVPESVLVAYSHKGPLEFGPDYLLPKLIDPRLKEKVSAAVAKAAINSGVSLVRCSTA